MKRIMKSPAGKKAVLKLIDNVHISCTMRRYDLAERFVHTFARNIANKTRCASHPEKQP